MDFNQVEKQYLVAACNLLQKSLERSARACELSAKAATALAMRSDLAGIIKVRDKIETIQPKN